MLFLLSRCVGFLVTTLVSLLLRSSPFPWFVVLYEKSPLLGAAIGSVLAGFMTSFYALIYVVFGSFNNIIFWFLICFLYFCR